MCCWPHHPEAIARWNGSLCESRCGFADFITKKFGRSNWPKQSALSQSRKRERLYAIRGSYRKYMNAIAPGIAITILATFCVALMVAGLYRGLQRSGRSDHDSKRIASGVVVVVLLWAATVAVLAKRGFFSDFTATPPRLLIALVSPGLAMTVALVRSKALDEALKATPVSWLLLLQTFRVIVELLLWNGYRHGVIPVQMTFEGRNFDILAGLTAPIAAWYWGRTRSKAFVVIWNVAGLCLLANIVVVAILSMPTSFRVFTEGPANTLLTRFPFIFLPAILVPIAYITHSFSLKQIASRDEVRT
jgi:hypothetical protein